MSHRRVLVPFALLATVGALLAAPSIALAQAVCGVGSDALGNGGFETPGVPADDIGIFTTDQIPPWQTTDSGGVIEVWGDGFQGVPAFEGVDFAEINANSAGTLYQDVVSTPGATMTWTVHHRGRLGDDTMRVLIGDATTADVNGDTGWDFTSADLVDGAAAWGQHTGEYVVPDGQTCTRFAFRAVASTGGDASFGNLIDAIAFVVTIPAEPSDAPPAATVRPTIPPTDTVQTSAPTSLLAGLLPLVALLLVAGLGAVATVGRR